MQGGATTEYPEYFEEANAADGPAPAESSREQVLRSALGQASAPGQGKCQVPCELFGANHVI